MVADCREEQAATSPREPQFDDLRRGARQCRLTLLSRRRSGYGGGRAAGMRRPTSDQQRDDGVGDPRTPSGRRWPIIYHFQGIWPRGLAPSSCGRDPSDPRAPPSGGFILPPPVPPRHGVPQADGMGRDLPHLQTGDAPLATPLPSSLLSVVNAVTAWIGPRPYSRIGRQGRGADHGGHPAFTTRRNEVRPRGESVYGSPRPQVQPEQRPQE